MAFSKEQIDELKANLAFARKREMPFGLCIGKAAETTVLVNHKTKDPEALGRQAKKEGETAKIAFGMMTVEGKNLNLSCAGDVPSGLARKTREMMKLLGLKLKVRILDAAGNALEEDGDDEEDAEGAADPATEAWLAGKARVEAALTAAAETKEVDLEPARTLWAEVGAVADGGDLEGATGRVPDVEKMVAEAVAAAEMAEGDRKRWETAAEKIAPMVQEAMDAGSPVAPKINAVWSFAQTKAGGNPPDFASAVKSITMLVKLIDDSRKLVAKGGTAAAPAPAMAGNGAGNAATAEAAPAGAGPAGGAPAGATPAAAAPAGAAPADAAPAPAGGAAAPPAGAGAPAAPPAAAGPAPKADLKGTAKEKFDRAEAALKAVDALIATYMGLIPGSAEPMPPAWTTERTRIDDVLKPMRAPGAALDEPKLDKALTDLAKFEGLVRDKSTEKGEWKRTLDLFQVRLVPLDRHAQAGAVPQVKPKIDAIKADMAKAVAKADKQDFKGATAGLAPLVKRCEDTELLADGFAHYTAILTERTNAFAALPPVASGFKSLDDLKAKITKLFTDAAALATAGKYPDAVAKLDQMPPLVEQFTRTEDQRQDYNRVRGPIATRFTAINTRPADVRAPFQTLIDGWKKQFDDSDIAKTKDYAVSVKAMFALIGLMFDKPPNPAAGTPLIPCFIEREMDASQRYKTAKAAFDPQLALFKAHLGRSGVEEFYQAMEKDAGQAASAVTSGKYSTAAALLERSAPDWGTQKTNADNCLAYITKRDAVALVIAGLKGNPAAAAVLAQAEALMATAVTQNLKKDFAAALATVTEAEQRAADAKTAADAQGDLGKLKDGAALDGMAADFDKAIKVFDDMRANVVSKDAGGAFAALIATADAPAQKARDEKAKPAPDYGLARTELDKAIAILEGALPKIMAKGPFDTHLAAAKTAAAALAPLNIDDCIKGALTTVTTRITEAEALAKTPTFDFPGAEAKLVEAKAAGDAARADGGLWPAIKADRATIVATKAAITPAAIVTMMAARIKQLDDAVAETDAQKTAGNFKAAAAAAKAGAALQVATVADTATCVTITNNINSWYTLHLPALTGPGREAAVPHLATAQAKITAVNALVAQGGYAGALSMTSEVSWAVTAAHRAVAEQGTYEPARVTADTKIKAVAAIRNAGVETALQAVEKKYADAVAEAAKGNYFGAERVMKEIPAEVDPLLAKAQAWKLYDDARRPAETKLVAAEGHKAAAAIQPMLTRLRAKYDAAVTQSATDAAGAKTAMDEIVPAADEAIKSADNSAMFADAAAAGNAIGPNAATVLIAKKALEALRAKPEAPASKTDLDEAAAQLASLDASGVDPATANAAFKAATDALTRAEMAQSQARMLGETVKAAKAKVAELKAHPQAGYIASEVAALETEADDVAKQALAGTDPAGATAKLETTMASVATTKAMADAQAEYITLRATPEVEPRLEVLEKHAHRYAIKANIDTIRTKLKSAADCSTNKKPQDAVKLLQEVKALALSSLVLADMRENKPPSVADVKAIMAGPGGVAELDAMIDTLEPDAQKAVLRVAFEARYGCKLDNFSGDDGFQGTGVVADGVDPGPNVKKFYQLLADLPSQDVVKNDSMRKFSIVEATGGVSFYSGDNKDVVMREGDETLSAAYRFGEEFEVGKVEPGCEPANKDEVKFFSWNTSHEVGHALDDKHGFMDKHAGQADYGGWQMYGLNVGPIAAALAAEFQYDVGYIADYLAHRTGQALPPVPTGGAAPTPEEWEARRVRVCAYVDLAGVSNDPWSSNSVASRLNIGGTVYQESYPNTWSSYAFAARARGITGYQFRAPGEWFSELYAAFHAQKLKPEHPAYGWLSAL